MFKKKRAKRLYYPVKSKWYTKPRRKRTKKKLIKGGFKGLKKMILKSLYLMILIGAFAVIILFLAFSSYFSIRNIEVDRTTFSIDSSSIESELKQYVGKNMVFFAKSRIYKTIQTLFPEFETVKVKKVLPSTLKISLESYPIVANLRAYYVLPEAEEMVEEDFTELSKAIEELSGTEAALATLETDSPLRDEEVLDDVFTLEGYEEEKPDEIEQKALLNRNGQVIFDQEENLELMTISVYGLSQPVEDRERVVQKDHMDDILGAISHIKNVMNLETKAIRYLPVAREIHLKTSDNLIIWISIDRDYKEQIDKLATVYEPAELSNEEISYIDLRVREKIIYCPINAHCNQ